MASAMLVLLVSLLAVFGGTAGASGSEISALRLGDHGERTRLVIDLDKPVTYKVFTLADPYRVVIDLQDAQFSVEPSALPAPRGVIKRLRYGLFKSDVARIVVDADGPVKIAKAFQILPRPGYPDRLVLDLEKTDPASFLTAMDSPKTGYAKVGSSHIAASKKAPEKKANSSTLASVPKAAPALVVPAGEPLKPVVVIDPGHGGIDPGAIGRSGIYEKEIVLSAAKILRDILEATGRYEVVMTRTKDVFVPLKERVAFARRSHGDLFVSLHADSLPSAPTLRGASVYTLSEEASDAEAAALAKSENDSDLLAGLDFGGQAPDIQNILLDLAQRETMNESIRFAKMTVEHLGRRSKLIKRPHRFAGFRVLKAPDIPSVLVELGFLSNRHDEANLRGKNYRKKLMLGLADSIDSFFALNRSLSAN